MAELVINNERILQEKFQAAFPDTARAAISLDQLLQNSPGLPLSGFTNQPIFDRLRIPAGSTPATRDNPNGIAYDEFVFEYDPVIDCSQAKEIVKSRPWGVSSGTVKEWIGIDDWSISIRGILSGSDGTFPEAEVNALKTICQINASLAVESRLFNIYGIEAMVIEDYDFKSVVGFPDSMAFVIKACSDEPLELETLNDD